MKPLAITFLAAGLSLAGLAVAQPPADDPAAAVAKTAAEEAAMAGRARDVTRSAIDTVFGSGQGAAPAPAAVPAEGAAPPDGAAAVPVIDPNADPAPGEEVAVEIVDTRRDPFRPFTLDLRPDLEETEILSPLQRYELPQLRLAGVVLDLRPPRAMLQDSSGMGFIVTPGTPIGRRHGVVKSIEPRRVVVEEVVLDYYGRETIHQVVIDMPSDEKADGASQEKP